MYLCDSGLESFNSRGKRFKLTLFVESQPPLARFGYSRSRGDFLLVRSVNLVVRLNFLRALPQPIIVAADIFTYATRLERDGAGDHIVQECPVVAHQENRARKFYEPLFQQFKRLSV